MKRKSVKGCRQNGSAETAIAPLKKRRHLAACGILALSLTGCGLVVLGAGIKGSGVVVSKQYELGDFSQVTVGSTFRAKITQGTNYSVAVSADDNLLEHLDITKSGDTLHIGLKPNVSIRNATLKVEVTMPDLRGLDLSGATHTTITGFSSDKSLDGELGGASHLRGDIKSGDTRLRVSGASHVELEGTTERLRINASGASHVNLERYFSKETRVDAGGASHVTVNAIGKLEASASGASSVRYMGQPASVETRTSGSSSVRRK